MKKTDTYVLRLSALVGMLLLLLTANKSQAQDKFTFGDDFIFFINGANVLIPNLDGGVADDPLNPTSDNKVFQIDGNNWAEAGFDFGDNGPRETTGVDASSFVGTNYGESDTLFVRLLSPAANIDATGNIFLAMLDTRTGLEFEVDDLPFRLRWTIPDSLHDGQWHDLAIPLPPSTIEALDSAKKGLKLDGTALDVPVDSSLKDWNYSGAWANGVGVWTPADAGWQPFDWESVSYFGIMRDYPEGPSVNPIYFDYYSIGVRPENLDDTPPSAATGLAVQTVDGVNSVTFDAVDGAGGYNVYFSENEIASVTGEGVQLISALGPDDALSVNHELLAPHPVFAKGFTGYYAVTAKSPFGSESDAATVQFSGDIAASPLYAVELSTEDVEALNEVFADESRVVPAAETIAGYFPEGYTPIEINSERSQFAVGEGPITDEDLSGKIWLGYDAELNDLFLYAEVNDDIIVPAPRLEGETRGQSGAAAWNYDNFELGLSNYTPQSFIIGSTHGAIERGNEPDYQFRSGFFDGDLPFVHSSWALNNEIPFSATFVDSSSAEGSYRVLTVFPTASLSTTENEDRLFQFPTGDNVTYYPFNFALNDADATGTRETQLAWGSKPGQDVWYNTPSTWDMLAFVGKDAVGNENAVNNEASNMPQAFELEQNYPNPFNPSTNIAFTLANATNVTLEVFNVIGQRVAVLANNDLMTPGKHTFNFDASNLASGMYLYRLTTPDFSSSKKMILVK